MQTGLKDELPSALVRICRQRAVGILSTRGELTRFSLACNSIQVYYQNLAKNAINKQKQQLLTTIPSSQMWRTWLLFIFKLQKSTFRLKIVSSGLWMILHSLSRISKLPKCVTISAVCYFIHTQLQRVCSQVHCSVTYLCLSRITDLSLITWTT